MMSANGKKAVPPCKKGNEMFQEGEWLGIIYTIERSIDDPCNAWLPGGRPSKRQRNRYDIHIQSSHDM